MLGFEVTGKAGFDVVPVLLVDLDNLQAVPPGLGLALEDAGQRLGFSLVIPGGDVGGNLNSLDESAASLRVLGFHRCETRASQ